MNKFFVGKPIYDAILADLNHAISDTVWMSPDAFVPHLTEVLSKATTDKKLLEKIADGLSVMDKNAEIQRDRKGNVVYDKETKDTELVKWEPCSVSPWTNTFIPTWEPMKPQRSGSIFSLIPSMKVSCGSSRGLSMRS